MTAISVKFSPLTAGELASTVSSIAPRIWGRLRYRLPPTVPTDLADVLTGTSGQDTIDGLAGNDTISGLGDDDLLIGGPGTDTLNGGTGNDTLNGGIALDFLDGGSGTDTATYADATTALIVDLANPGVNTGEAAGDTFTSIENLTGSSLNDNLRGDPDPIRFRAAMATIPFMAAVATTT